jgi:hypothetical protein
MPPAGCCRSKTSSPIQRVLESAEFSCIGSRRRRSAPPQAARSGTPYGHAAWAPVPSAVPIGRPTVRRPAADSPQHYRQVHAATARQGRRGRPDAHSLALRVAYGHQPAAPFADHGKRLLHASGGGLRHGDRQHHARLQVYRWFMWEPGHSLRRRPRQSQADQASGLKVVRPVGRSTFTPDACPASPEGGTTAEGMTQPE